MSKKEQCPNCQRYTAEQKGIFSSPENLKCHYCHAEINRRPVKKGCLFFRKTVGYEVVKVKGGEKWRSNWQKARLQALERAKNRCEKCRTIDVQLDVHHKKRVVDGGTDDLSNLQVLCVTCHAAVHAER